MRRRLREVRTLRVGAAVAALVLSLGLVVRLSISLTPWAPETRGAGGAERAIVLVDDAAGVSLFDDVALVPGERVRRCVRLTTEGTRRPQQVDLRATAEVDPALAGLLTARVERGSGSCRVLPDPEVLADGSADDVLSQLAEDPAAWEPQDEDRTGKGFATVYRFTLALDEDAPDAVQGAGATFDLEWSTTYNARGDTPGQTVVALLVRTGEDSVVPIILVLALAVLFLGVQDRLDRNSHKLEDADAVDEVVPFARRDPSSADRL